jgi:type IV pilus assembly protein PilM
VSLLAKIKSTLGLGDKTVLGVDIGLSQIKVCEVKKSGSTFKVTGYASVDLPEGALIEDDIQKPEEITEAFAVALTRLSSSIDNYCLGISGPNTVARRLQLAGGTEEEIDDQVSWEVEQYLPFDAEDSVIAYHNYGSNEGGGVDVLIAAARVDIVEMFKELVDKENKKKVKIVDLGVTAVTNVFEHVLIDKIASEEESTIFLDIGAQKTHFIIYRGGAIYFAKEINIGGVMITEEIQRQMGVNYEEAENLKIFGDNEGNLPEDIVEIIEDVLESFFAELKKTIDFYISSTSDDSLKEVYVTGGAAQTPGILDGISEALGREVHVFNPFEKISFDKKKFKEEDLNDMAFRGVASIGLGMRSGE